MASNTKFWRKLRREKRKLEMSPEERQAEKARLSLLNKERKRRHEEKRKALGMPTSYEDYYARNKDRLRLKRAAERGSPNGL